MNKSAFLITICLVILFGCKQTDEKTPKPSLIQDSSEGQNLSEGEIKDLPLQEFMKRYSQESKESAVLIDVRTPPEYNDGYIKGAIMINFLDEDIDKQLGMLDKSKTYYLYCQQGGRSTKCMNKMKAMGFKTIFNLIGGYSAYSAEYAK